MVRQESAGGRRRHRQHGPTGALRGLILLCMAGVMSGCSGVVPPASGPAATLASTSATGNTVAFESIDGAPPQVFERYVQVLDAEAQGRNVPVVSRSMRASYHVRSYLSAQVRGGRTVIAWLWDVYDGNQQRVLRLHGEEEATRSAPRDAWAAADADLLRRIAQTALIRLSGYVNGTAPPQASPPDRGGPAVAALSDAASSDVTALAYGAH